MKTASKCFLLPFFLFTVVSFSSELVLIPENILDVRTGKLIKGSIHIKNDTIVSISNEIKSSSLNIIELNGITLMPGLMDAHVHLIGNNELNGYESISESSEMATLYGVKNAKNTLLAGFTTVRNVGAGNFADVALRDAIKKGVVLGPRMIVSGPTLSI